MGFEMTEVIVAKIGRAHGIRGDFFIDLRTDEPELRFKVGEKLKIQGEKIFREVTANRKQGNRLVLHLQGIDDRNLSEALTGKLLFAEVGDESPADPEEFYDRQLIGLQLLTSEGENLGEITEVWHAPAQDILVAGEIAVPFVSELVERIDLGSKSALLTDKGSQVVGR